MTLVSRSTPLEAGRPLPATPRGYHRRSHHHLLVFRFDGVNKATVVIMVPIPRWQRCARGQRHAASRTLARTVLGASMRRVGLGQGYNHRCLQCAAWLESVTWTSASKAFGTEICWSTKLRQRGDKQHGHDNARHRLFDRRSTHRYPTKFVRRKSCRFGVSICTWIMSLGEYLLEEVGHLRAYSASCKPSLTH